MTEATKKIVPDIYIEGMTAQTAMKSDARTRGPRRRVRVLRERRRQVRDRPDPGGRRRPRHARLSVDRSVIGGWVETEFEPVLDAFAANFDERGEVGAAVCVYRDGRPVVDLWGGVADPATGRPWAEDSIVARLLVDEGCHRGLREPADRARAARSRRGGREVLARVRGGRQGRDHGAAGHEPPGRAAVGRRRCSRSTRCSRGTRSSSSSRVRNRSGSRARSTATTCARSAGSSASSSAASPARRPAGSFGDEVADPLGIDFWIGLPEALEPRVASLVPPRTDIRARCSRRSGDRLLLARVFDNPSGLFNYDDMWNTRALHARGAAVVERHRQTRASLARLYASLVGDGSTACGRCSRPRSRPRRSRTCAARTR